VGIRLRTLGAPRSVPALDHAALDDERARAEDEEERRLLYVAMTRARETLILSGTLDVERPPQPRPGGAPLSWIAPAIEATGVAPVVNTPGSGVLRPAPPVAVAPPHAGTALPVAPALGPAPAPAGPVLAGLPRRLSYTSLGEFGRCGYRWYLQRVLGLPDAEPPPGFHAPPGERAGAALDPRVRGTIVHELLEALDFARPAAPAGEAVAAVAASHGAELTAESAADVARLVEAFAASPLCERLARASGVRREAPFAFALEPGAGALLVHGVVDVLATERDGSALVVDYKTDRLDGAVPEEMTARDYAAQRLVYALAALRNGAPRVEVAHCYLERPAEPAVVTFTQPDAPALAERLLGLAEGVLAGEFGVTDRPHRELCATCPGRRALCSHPESVTLRAPEEAVAAAVTA
jgi:hypothetical protein